RDFSRRRALRQTLGRNESSVLGHWRSEKTSFAHKHCASIFTRQSGRPLRPVQPPLVATGCLLRANPARKDGPPCHWENGSVMAFSPPPPAPRPRIRGARPPSAPPSLLPSIGIWPPTHPQHNSAPKSESRNSADARKTKSARQKKTPPLTVSPARTNHCSSP